MVFTATTILGSVTTIIKFKVSQYADPIVLFFFHANLTDMNPWDWYVVIAFLLIVASHHRDSCLYLMPFKHHT